MRPLAALSAAVVMGLSMAVFPAQAQDTTDGDTLIWSDEVFPGFDNLPRLTGQGAAAINARFQAMDAFAAQERAGCLESDPDHAEWTRTVSAPFPGPRFLSILINQGYYCGGAHPSVELRRLTFDRASGEAATWDALWPGAGWLSTEDYGAGQPPETRDPRLVAWFRGAVRAHPENDAEWLGQCEAYYGEDPVDEAVVVWLDGASGMIGMDWASLPHAAMACGSAQFMDAGTAAALGASPELIAALAAGREAFKGRDIL